MFLCKKAHKISHPIQIAPSMLKWVRFCGAKFRPQNETCSNVKIEKMGEVGKGENGVLIEWTYWIEKVDGRDRRWIVLV